MFYKDSSEKFNYVNEVDKEKKAVGNLAAIKKKPNFELVDPKIEEEQALKRDQEEDGYHTAKGGKRLLEIDELIRHKVIVVDMREFSGSTPQYLYDAGFWVVPMQLSIADFVLSDTIAIENKAISTHDLHESLRSGRLLEQITMMSKFYTQSILLLEFDDNIDFKLKEQYRYESLNDKEIDNKSVFTKLTLLLMNFPNVTVFWSKNKKETVKIFQKLKRDSGNPDLERIEKIGKVLKENDKLVQDPEDLEDITFDDKGRNKYLPQDFLRSLPGVTNKNVNILFKGVNTIEKLVNKTEQEMKELCGDDSGKKIHALLHNMVSYNS